MKTEKFLLKVCVLFSLVLFITSCDDSDDYPDEFTYQLCRTAWVTTYWDHGYECEMILDFDKNGRGIETHKIYYSSNEAPDIEEYPFYWTWNSIHNDGILLEYAPGDYSYLLNAEVNDSRLKGEIGGEKLRFTRISSY